MLLAATSPLDLCGTVGLSEFGATIAPSIKVFRSCDLKASYTNNANDRPRGAEKGRARLWHSLNANCLLNL
jgi:hypothetical protein